MSADELSDNARYFAGAVREVLDPPSDGASLGGILNAYILKARLEEVGYAIVPSRPTPKMVKAFLGGPLFSGLRQRYKNMINAAWD